MLKELFWACLPEPCVPAAEGKIAKHAKGEVVASFQNEAQLRKDPRGQEFGAEWHRVDWDYRAD